MMQPALRSGLAVAAALGLAVAACHHRNREAASAGREADPEMADTLEGRVHVGGVQPFPKVTLVTDSGGRAVALVGPEALARVAGLRVAVTGTSSGTQFTVKRFRVVAANGVPATDGRLVADGDSLALVTEDGARHPLGRPSPGLWEHVGRRVWIAGPLDGEPVSYGVIE
jgi:hypothetical protein